MQTKRVCALALIAMVSMSLLGCLELVSASINSSQIDAEMKPCVGSTKDQLVKAWGPQRPRSREINTPVRFGRTSLIGG